MNERTCIVSKNCHDPDEMIRFVANPNGEVVPDIKRTLPGRGVWVYGGRDTVEKAVSKNIFARQLKRNVTVSSSLGNDVDALLERFALAGLGISRKAGQCITGANKIDTALRSGKVAVLVHSKNAAADGIRKLSGAIHASKGIGGSTKVFILFDSDQMSITLGGTNVVHAAITRGGAANSFIKRAETLVRYRGGSPETRKTNQQAVDGFSKDVCKV